MTTENLEQPAEEVTHEPAPAPVENPRNAIIKSIAAKAFEQHAKDLAESEATPSVDDDHNITPAAKPAAEPPAPAAAPEQAATPSAEPSSQPPEPEAPAGAPAAAPARPPVDPEGDYEVIIEGQKMTVKGSTLIDAGYRTVQKEAAADHKLRLASQLLEEAERRVGSTRQGDQPAPPPAPKGRTEEQLAHALQFGTPEDSANAVRELRSGGFSEEKILQLVEERSRLVAADEFEFRRGQALLSREFKDLMERPAMKRLFESEDMRMLQAGDRRPYVERYRAIGEQLRKDFGLAKPAAPAPAGEQPASGTAPARQAAKAKAPSVPRTAAARLGEGGGEQAKPASTSDVIAAMAAARGKNKLTEPPATRRR